MMPICHTWSITLIRAKPASSAAAAIRVRSSARVVGPPGKVKSAMCTPSFMPDSFNEDG